MQVIDDPRGATKMSNLGPLWSKDKKVGGGSLQAEGWRGFGGEWRGAREATWGRCGASTRRWGCARGPVLTFWRGWGPASPTPLPPYPHNPTHTTPRATCHVAAWRWGSFVVAPVCCTRPLTLPSLPTQTHTLHHHQILLSPPPHSPPPPPKKPAAQCRPRCRGA
jgi:hypothetical protein